MCSTKLLVTFDLQPMQVSKMSFRSDMREEMRNVAKSRFPGTDSAVEEFRRHDEPKERQQQMKFRTLSSVIRKAKSTALTRLHLLIQGSRTQGRCNAVGVRAEQTMQDGLKLTTRLAAT